MRAFIVALAILLSNLPGTARAETLYFIHVDHLGTPRLAIGEDNVERWRWEQAEPFGDNPPIEVMGPEGYLVDLPLRFAGQYADKETNNHYNWNRWYDPAIGRYTQFDLVGLASGINGYAYAYDNPLSFFDPEGLLGRAPGSGPTGTPVPNLSVCSYYDQIARQYGCKYHAFAGQVCRGQISTVNILNAACLLSTSQLNCIRTCLVEADKFWRNFPACQVMAASNCPPGSKNCTKLSCINDYHAGCFSRCGLSNPACYGGNFPGVSFPNDGD